MAIAWHCTFYVMAFVHARIVMLVLNWHIVQPQYCAAMCRFKYLPILHISNVTKMSDNGCYMEMNYHFNTWLTWWMDGWMFSRRSSEADAFSASQQILHTLMLNKFLMFSLPKTINNLEDKLKIKTIHQTNAKQLLHKASQMWALLILYCLYCCKLIYY